MVGKIFINYRRHESVKDADHLFTSLIRNFPVKRVFIDRHGIEGGKDWLHELERQVAASDAMLALIGKDWVSITNDSGQRRIDDENDFVRFEIAEALRRNIPIIPVLLDGAQMPKPEQLPPNLMLLTRQHAMLLRSESFREDADRIAAALKELLKQRRRSGVPVWQAVGGAVLTLIGGALVGPFVIAQLGLSPPLIDATTDTALRLRLQLEETQQALATADNARREALAQLQPALQAHAKAEQEVQRQTAEVAQLTTLLSAAEKARDESLVQARAAEAKADTASRRLADLTAAQAKREQDARKGAEHPKGESIVPSPPPKSAADREKVEYEAARRDKSIDGLRKYQENCRTCVFDADRDIGDLEEFERAKTLELVESYLQRGSPALRYADAMELRAKLKEQQRDKRCGEYAKEAVEASARARELECGFLREADVGQRWSIAPLSHRQICMRLTAADDWPKVEAEKAIRASALQQCGKEQEDCDKLRVAMGQPPKGVALQGTPPSRTQVPSMRPSPVVVPTKRGQPPVQEAQRQIAVLETALREAGDTKCALRADAERRVEELRAAERQREEKRWAEVRISREAKDYRRHAEEFPTGPNVIRAREIADDIDACDAAMKGSLELPRLRSYLATTKVGWCKQQVEDLVKPPALPQHWQLNLHKSATIRDIRFVPGGDALLVLSSVGLARLELATGRLRFVSTSAEAADAMTSDTALVSPDGRMLVLARPSGLRIYDTAVLNLAREFKPEGVVEGNPIWSDSGRHVAALTRQPNRIAVWDVSSGAGRNVAFERAGAEATELALSADGGWLAAILTSSANVRRREDDCASAAESSRKVIDCQVTRHEVAVWNISTNQRFTRISARTRREPRATFDIETGKEKDLRTIEKEVTIQTVAFSPDSQHLYVAFDDHIEKMPRTSGNPSWRLDSRFDQVMALPGDKLLTRSGSRYRVVDETGGSANASVSTGSSQRGAVLSADTRWLATHDGKVVRFWSVGGRDAHALLVLFGKDVYLTAVRSRGYVGSPDVEQQFSVVAAQVPARQTKGQLPDKRSWPASEIGALRSWRRADINLLQPPTEGAEADRFPDVVVGRPQ